MRKFFLSSQFFKQLPSTESDINEQLKILNQLVTSLSAVDPIFSNWYVNNASSSKPPLEYLFPSESASTFLLKQREKETFSSFLLWNGQEEKLNYSSISLSVTDINMTFYKNFEPNQAIKIFEVLLAHLKFKYLYVNNNFFIDINIFPHRLETTSICYVPKKIEEGDIPHLYKKIDIDNELNQGTILVFDQNLFDESDEMKKKVQENSIALVDLDLIPEAELDADFFSEA